MRQPADRDGQLTGPRVQPLGGRLPCRTGVQQVLGVLACLTKGGTIIPLESFHPERVLQTVEKEKCTVLHGVPTMFIAELDHPNFHSYDLSTLRTG
ncbi:AMP-binding protein, partial [Streptomyces sp. NPDC057621]|uniref:AMP-binding protein n=1 Tax=Streptomyces sp. NPDC057621 TaxID=3346186 RepID=UPI00369EB376